MANRTDLTPRQRRRRRARSIRNAILGLVGPWILRAWGATLRVKWVGVEHRVGKLPVQVPGIYVFWHQRLLAFAGIFHHSGYRGIVSQHGDGEMLARIMIGLGLTPIRGSSTRGGSRAILELLRTEGVTHVAVTPDGPQGPRHEFRGGAVFLASRSGLPLIPISVAYAHKWRLPTWDGFVLPMPFTATIIRRGEPLFVPPDLDRDGLEEARKKAETILRELTDSTDAEFREFRSKARATRELIPLSPPPSLPLPLPRPLPLSPPSPPSLPPPPPTPGPPHVDSGLR